MEENIEGKSKGRPRLEFIIQVMENMQWPFTDYLSRIKKEGKNREEWSLLNVTHTHRVARIKIL